MTVQRDHLSLFKFNPCVILQQMLIVGCLMPITVLLNQLLILHVHHLQGNPALHRLRMLVWLELEERHQEALKKAAPQLRIIDIKEATNLAPLMAILECRIAMTGRLCLPLPTCNICLGVITTPARDVRITEQ